jgi:hypothetical protein
LWKSASPKADGVQKSKVKFMVILQVQKGMQCAFLAW